MANPADAFARKGLALAKRVQRLDRVTRGRFDGEAGVALETARLYAGAAANALLALSSQSSLSEERRSAAAVAGHAFRRAAGVLATHFPGGDTVPSLGDLADPAGNRLRQRFEAAAPLVTVSTAARSALDTLRRDPLFLAELGADALLSLMADAAAGVLLAEPGA